MKRNKELLNTSLYPSQLDVLSTDIFFSIFIPTNYYFVK